MSIDKLSSFEKKERLTYVMGNTIVDEEINFLHLYEVIKKDGTKVTIKNDSGEIKSYTMDWFESIERRNPRFETDNEFGPHLYLTDDEGDCYMCCNDYNHEPIAEGSKENLNNLMKVIIICRRNKMLLREERMNYYKEFLNSNFLELVKSGTVNELINFITDGETTGCFTPYDKEDDYWTYMELKLDGTVKLEMDYSVGGCISEYKGKINFDDTLTYFENLVGLTNGSGDVCFMPSAHINFMNKFLKNEIKFKEE